MLSRPQLAARIHTLRSAMDLLCDQSDRDLHGKYFCYGPMKVELIRMESDLAQLDGHPIQGVRGVA